MLRHWWEQVLLQHPGEGSLKPFPKKQSQTPSSETREATSSFSESLPTHVTCIFELSPSSNKILLKTGHWYFNRSHYEKLLSKSQHAKHQSQLSDGDTSPHRAQSQYLLDNSFLLNKKSKTVEEGEKIHRTLDYSATQHLNSTLLLTAS